MLNYMHMLDFGQLLGNIAWKALSRNMREWESELAANVTWACIFKDNATWEVFCKASMLQ